MAGEQLALHDHFKLFHIHGAGGDHLALDQLSVELLVGNIPAVQVIVVLFSLYKHGQGHHTDSQLLRQGRRQVAGGIGDDNKFVVHGKLSS